MATTKKGRKVALLSGLALVALFAVTAWMYWEEIRFFIEFERLGNNEQGYLEYRHRETGIIFVRLPGGTFDMGTADTSGGFEDAPVHKVTLSPFLIAKYEVTQAEWKKVMGNNPSGFRGDALPVESVSWDDCQNFCEKAGLSLPTEAQWEYACRAGQPGPFSGTGSLDDMGWYADNSGRKTHPVGKKEPNQFGLYDMHGNVAEWCEDVYDPEFYSTPEATRKDPVCTAETSGRVMRGDGWSIGAHYCRSAFRGFVPSIRAASLSPPGLRPARPSP